MLKKLNYSVAKGLDVFVPTCKTPFLLTSFFLITFLLVGFTGFSQRTEILDANFRKVLLGKYGISADSDNTILNSEAIAVTSLDVQNKNIASLIGIEAFTALIDLNCNNNKLSILDVSRNKMLKTLYCNNNLLSALDVSINKMLRTLRCNNNKLLALDVSKNTRLIALYCNNNLLLALDLSKNTALRHLSCTNNRLTSLDISNGNNKRLILSLTTKNADLTCINVDNVIYGKKPLWTKDATALYSEHCGATLIPDRNFEQVLIDLGYDSGNIDGVVLTANILGITSLDVSNKGIASLTGIEDFVALTTLYCKANKLKSLDISKNTRLISLRCSNNELSILDVSRNKMLSSLYCNNNKLLALDVSKNTRLAHLRCNNNKLLALDVSKNTRLAHLHCYNNKLSVLDVSKNTRLIALYCNNNLLLALDLSKNTALRHLSCANNRLTSLDISNGNNNRLILSLTTKNADLTCINVDNVIYGEKPLWTKDATALYSEHCGATLIPDRNFEQALIDLGYDSGNIDGVVLTANILAVTSLDVSNKKIASLTGIEDFVALTTLYCKANKLKSLDVSSNTALTRLYCSYNSLSGLDVSKNKKLYYLDSEHNQLRNLDISKNTRLISLRCGYNSLSVLDVSKNTRLAYLHCNNNLLSVLDVSRNKMLRSLYCNNNKLLALDLSKNTALRHLSCVNNRLTSLDISNGNNKRLILSLTTKNADLTCIKVDDASYKRTALWTKDATALYSEDCSTTTTITITTTNIPDSNFEQALIDLGIDTNGKNGNILNSDAKVVYSLNVRQKGIKNLSGIRAFTSLTQLNCRSNSLTSLDVSANTALTQLNCNFNNLRSLNVSNNHELNSLRCKNNKLTSLNIKNGNNRSLRFFKATNNPDLICIQVDDANYSIVNLSNIDKTASFSKDCSNPTKPKSKQEQTILDFDGNKDFEKIGISISPNPTKGFLNITVNEKADYTLLNIRGQILKKGVLSTGESKIDISSFAKGIYLLNIKTGKGSFIEKIVRN